MGTIDREGNITPGKGSLYSLHKGVLKRHESGIGCSNGLAWDTKQTKMYYVDTLVPAVFQYDYSNTGTLSKLVPAPINLINYKVLSFLMNYLLQTVFVTIALYRVSH